MAGIVLGKDCKLYFNTDPDPQADPVWDEVGNVRDLTLTLEKAEADVSTRGGGGWRQRAYTLKDATVEFQMVYNNGDPQFTVIKDAFLNDTQIDAAVMDGDITETGPDPAPAEGLRAPMEVGTFTRNEELENAVLTDVTMAPGYDPAFPPDWITGPLGSVNDPGGS